MTPPSPGVEAKGPRRASTVAVVRVLLVGLLTISLLAGTVAVAAEDGNPGKSCPGENDNQGFANADEEGVIHSEEGIANAAQRIGCGVASADGGPLAGR